MQVNPVPCQDLIRTNSLALLSARDSPPSWRRHKSGGEPGDDGQDECEHGGDITAGRDESLDFSTLSEFLVGIGMMRRCFEVRMQSC